MQSTRSRARQPQALNETENAYALRLSDYGIKVEQCGYQIRQVAPKRRDADRADDAARAEYDSNQDLYPVMHPLPTIGSSEYTDLWRKIDRILARNANSAKDLYIQYITGSFAMSLIASYELRGHPHQLQIMNVASARTWELMPREDGDTDDSDEEVAASGLKATDLVGRKIRCEGRHGRELEFIIVDYGTSLSKGPWVKYLPRHGKEGEDEVTVAADEMEAMLKNAEVLS